MNNKNNILIIGVGFMTLCFSNNNIYFDLVYYFLLIIYLIKSVKKKGKV